MGVDFPQIHMPYPFAIILPTPKKSTKELELGLSRMVHPMAAKMQTVQLVKLWITFHPVVKSIHEAMKHRFTSDFIYGCAHGL